METQNDSNSFLIPGAIVVAGVLIAGAVFYTNAPRPGGGAVPNLATVQAPAAPHVLGGDLTDDDPFLGSPDAPVVIVEFSDFQCPFCGRLYQNALPQIKEQYIKTGKVKFVYRDFPLSSIHNMAQKAAEASECADEQGQFWAYHDLLFERQQSLSVENFKTWAGELGLNTSQFDECLDSGKYVDEVQKDFRDGQIAGVTGTPGTFINGRLVPGAVPFSTFEAIIEEELKKAN
jgi:protein-disulfide isomerase